MMRLPVLTLSNTKRRRMSARRLKQWNAGRLSTSVQLRVQGTLAGRLPVSSEINPRDLQRIAQAHREFLAEIQPWIRRIVAVESLDMPSFVIHQDGRIERQEPVRSPDVQALLDFYQRQIEHAKSRFEAVAKLYVTGYNPRVATLDSESGSNARRATSQK